MAWLKSYLSDRTQKANITSKTENGLWGVWTTGLSLGPLLYFIFINGLPLLVGDIIRSVDLYADDMILYDIGLDKDTVENNLQYDFNLLKSWCLENDMIINTDKPKLLLISSQRNRFNMKDFGTYLWSFWFARYKLWTCFVGPNRWQRSMDKSFSTCFKKDIVISDKSYLSFHSYITMSI